MRHEREAASLDRPDPKQASALRAESYRAGGSVLIRLTIPGSQSSFVSAFTAVGSRTAKARKARQIRFLTIR